MDHASVLRVAYVGNFRPVHSTENHVRQALEANGHTVLPFQEDDTATWERLRLTMPGDFDLLLWTRTWHLPEADQAGVLNRFRELGVPSVGFHLDRWWGLDREHQVADEPFFRCDLMVTADGGHDDQWVAAGVDHVWMPPAVLRSEAVLGTPRPRFRSEVVFVGSWAGYHPQWQHRRDLIGWLGRTYGRRFAVWPRSGRSVRGSDLADLYGSVKVAVGDSCMLPDLDGTPSTHYWSDRIPETLGRGALLLHPETGGLEEAFGDGLKRWDLGRWDQLKVLIDRYLDDEPARAAQADLGRQVVLDQHLYEHRMAQLVALLDERGLLR